jgi:K+-transporting ATPase KdpF subunit
MGGLCNGLYLFGLGTAVIRPFLGNGSLTGKLVGDKTVETLIYGIGGVVSALLFGYLILALLKPEWFS